MLAADRAIGILAQLEFAEAHVESVDQQQTADERFALAKYQFDDFSGLNDADQTGKNTQHATLGATGREAWRGRFGVEAAVARTLPGGEDAGVALKAKYGTVNVGLAEQNAGVVHQVAGREVVRAVGHDVVVLENLEGVGAGQHGLVFDDADGRVEGGKLFGGGVELLAANILGGVDDLALEVAQIGRAHV